MNLILPAVIALGIIADSKSKFIAMFEVLKREIEENWV